MYKIICYCFFTILVTSCVSQKTFTGDISGTYTQTQNPNIKLIFSGNKFAFVDPQVGEMARFVCCDTITFGTWHRDGNLIDLSTPQLSIDSINLNVIQDHNQQLDTLYFRIMNPIESYFEFNHIINSRDIYYRIDLRSKSSLYFDKIFARTFNSNLVAIYKPRNVTLDQFSISAYPTADFGGRNIGIRQVHTKVYNVSGNQNNVFIIDIPQLSYTFLSYVRLNSDYIKIHSSSKLEWDGEIYNKE